MEKVEKEDVANNDEKKAITRTWGLRLRKRLRKSKREMRRMRWSRWWEDYWFISEASTADAKVENDLGQVIICMSDLSSKVDKVCKLHAAY